MGDLATAISACRSRQSQTNLNLSKEKAVAHRSYITKKLQNIYYRVMMPYWQSQFSPYIGTVNIEKISSQFFYGMPLSRSWYDPIKPDALAEYIWVQENLNLAGQSVIDAGAHHGHYSSYFASLGGNVTAIDPLRGNSDLVRVNAAINEFKIEVVEAAVSNKTGYETFIPRSNGKFFSGTGIKVPVRTLAEINANESVVKLDIEGAEFNNLISFQWL
jgi:FkbM family methyltransferase